MGTYWSHARELAWEETARLLGIDSPGRTMFRVIAAALVVAGVWWFGSAEAWSSQLIGKVLATAVVVGALPLVFAWKLLISAPPKILAQEIGRVDTLNETIADFRRAAEPALEFVDDQDMARAKLAGMPDRSIVHRICVRNKSTTAKLDQMELTLLAVFYADTGKRRAVGVRLREATTGATQVTITPGARRYFEPLFVRPEKSPPRIYVAPGASNIAHHSCGPGRYLFEIEATSAMTQPQLQVYEVEMANDGNVRIRPRQAA